LNELKANCPEGQVPVVFSATQTLAKDNYRAFLAAIGNALGSREITTLREGVWSCESSGPEDEPRTTVLAESSPVNRLRFTCFGSLATEVIEAHRQARRLAREKERLVDKQKELLEAADALIRKGRHR
jgi:hypothetical protein